MGSFAKRGDCAIFRKKTGLSIKDCRQTETDAVTKSGRLSNSGFGRRARCKYTSGAASLVKTDTGETCSCLQSTQKDAKGFIKDSSALSAALEALAYQEGVVRSLIAALEKINE